MDTPTPIQMLEEIIRVVKQSAEQAHKVCNPIAMVVHPDSDLMRKAQRVVDAEVTENMTAGELASYVEGYLKDLAGDYPFATAAIFEHVFPTATVVVESDGTFTVDMDGKTS